MSEKMRKRIGIAGAIAVAVGTAAVVLSGGTVEGVGQIVAFSAAALAAALALWNGLKG